MLLGELLYDPWNSIGRVRMLELPVLFLSGQQDALVPSYLMSALHSDYGRLH